MKRRVLSHRLVYRVYERTSEGRLIDFKRREMYEHHDTYVFMEDFATPEAAAKAIVESEHAHEHDKLVIVGVVTADVEWVP